LLWGVWGGPVLAEPVSHHISMKVSLDSASDFKNIAGSSDKSKRQTRQLSVTLDNRDKEQVKDVSVKWAIYARKMQDHKLVTVKQGTVKTQIGALEATTVKSDQVTIKGTPKHSVTTRKTVRGKVQASTKHIPATGEEYYGYAVEVYAGATLIDEVYSQPSLRRGK
jgi:CCR4-NOT transcriptional regulation complex NOT5 subunit